MYTYSKNDNMTKELVWSSGQCFSGSLERLGYESWLQIFTLHTDHIQIKIKNKFLHAESSAMLTCLSFGHLSIKSESIGSR